MTTIVEQLIKAAELEKNAYFEYVKTYSNSSISALAKGGMDLDKATTLVKEACTKDAKANGLKDASQIFEKTAEYVQELETRLLELEKFAKEVNKEKEIEQSTPLTKLADLGFSKEELTCISSLPEDLVTKVASIGAQTWEMGSGVGMAIEKMDPLVEWILS